MNLLEGYVTEITGPVYMQYGKYWVPVSYDCWGRVSQTNLMFSTEEEALAVKVGHEFLC